MGPRWVCLLVLTGFLSGCSDQAPAAINETITTGSGPAEPTTTADGAEDGAIEGRVLDDELAPLGGATVTLLSSMQETTTDPDGAFRLDAITPGTHAVQAHLRGHEAITQNATVIVDEVTRLEFILAPIAAAVAYHESLPRTIYHHYGLNAVDSILNTQLGGSNPGCEGCVWSFKFGRPPDFLLLEIFGDHSVENPQGPAKEYVDLRTQDPANKFIVGAAMVLPVRFSANQTMLFGDHGFELASFCDSSWVCYEERRDLWATAFHLQAIPEGFTAGGDP